MNNKNGLCDNAPVKVLADLQRRLDPLERLALV
jgi:hypothetical protein